MSRDQVLSIAFRLEGNLPLANVWMRWHWAKRGRYMRNLSWQIFAAMESGPPLPLEPIPRCRIAVVRGSSGVPDPDGLVASVKPLLDCLVNATTRNPHGLGIIEDDGPEHIVELRATHEPAKRGQGYTEVYITAV